MVVQVEARDASLDAATFESDLRARFKEALSVTLEVEVVPRGSLASLTGLDSTSKIRRLLDRRA
jgi:phenylacetate-coenzyme A ligase PaaK-like adenylate-forming protein